MNDRLFDSPVYVKEGSSLIQEIACLEDALEFLYNWPKHRRDPVYRMTLNACQSAFEGKTPLSAARRAFCKFAQSLDIFEEVTVPLPWATGPDHGHGGTALV